MILVFHYCRYFDTPILDDDHELLSPLSKPESFILRKFTQAEHLIPLEIQESLTPVHKSKERELTPETMALMK